PRAGPAERPRLAIARGDRDPVRAVADDVVPGHGGTLGRGHEDARLSIGRDQVAGHDAVGRVLQVNPVVGVALDDVVGDYVLICAVSHDDAVTNVGRGSVASHNVVVSVIGHLDAVV